MTLFPAGIEIFKDKRVGPGADRFTMARSALHRKLAGLANPKAIYAIPREELFEQVGFVVGELLENEPFELTSEEQTVLSRVLAFDLMETRGRNALMSHLLH